MATATRKQSKYNAEQQDALEHFLSLSPRKQERVFKLASLYAGSFDAQEKEEIRSALAEVLFPNPDDLRAEPLDDKVDSKAAKQQLKKHREYVAAQIAKQRAQRGWTQEELAKKAGLPQSHIARLERCVHAPTCLTLKKIAGALGIDPGLLDPSYESIGDDAD